MPFERRSKPRRLLFRRAFLVSTIRHIGSSATLHKVSERFYVGNSLDGFFNDALSLDDRLHVHGVSVRIDVRGSSRNRVELCSLAFRLLSPCRALLGELRVQTSSAYSRILIAFKFRHFWRHLLSTAGVFKLIDLVEVYFELRNLVFSLHWRRILRLRHVHYLAQL